MHPELDEEVSMMKDVGARAMTGSIASSMYRLKDIDNTYGGFFVFPDISLRQEGNFRIKFTLFEIIKYILVLLSDDLSLLAITEFQVK